MCAQWSTAMTRLWNSPQELPSSPGRRSLAGKRASSLDQHGTDNPEYESIIRRYQSEAGHIRRCGIPRPLSSIGTSTPGRRIEVAMRDQPITGAPNRLVGIRIAPVRLAWSDQRGCPAYGERVEITLLEHAEELTAILSAVSPTTVRCDAARSAEVIDASVPVAVAVRPVRAGGV